MQLQSDLSSAGLRTAAEGELRYPYNPQPLPLILSLVVAFGLAFGLYSLSRDATYAGLHGRGSAFIAMGAQIVSSFANVGLDAATRITFAMFALVIVAFGSLACIAAVYGRVRGTKLIVGKDAVSIANMLFRGSRSLAHRDIAHVELNAVRRIRFLGLQPTTGKKMSISAGHLPSQDEFEKVCATVKTRVAASHDARKS